MRFYICGGKGILSDISSEAVCVWVHYKYVITRESFVDFRLHAN